VYHFAFTEMNHMVLYFLLFSLAGCGGADVLEQPKPPPKWPMGTEPEVGATEGEALNEDGKAEEARSDDESKDTTPTSKEPALGQPGKEPVKYPKEPAKDHQSDPQPDQP
jgi:hypothetical protein